MSSALFKLYLTEKVIKLMYNFTIVVLVKGSSFRN